jgi:hypothetical protein
MSIVARVPMYIRSICVGILILIGGTAHAGTRGKIMGRVQDASGQPLPGVAVTISGTRLGAISDPDGRYFILQVPPGAHSVNAQLIGYRVVKVTKVRVSADLTTQTDFTLHEEALEVGAITIIAKRPDIEKDVTFSQTVMDADQADRLQLGSALSAASTFEPGASIGRQSSIRGGTSDQIRFQVDGIDRVDPLTNQANSQLNRFLVAEATVLVGGFNAEYGNVRSGVVNAVLKDGSERGPGPPWISGSVSYTPTHNAYFGPKAYDSDQYDYWLMSSKSPFDSVALERALYWPELYEETIADTAFMSAFRSMTSSRQATYKVFEGWTKQSQNARFAGGGKGMYGTRLWTPEAAREAWEWEANMDERSWQYSHEPSVSMNLGMGWALPKKMGGILLGYTYSKSMTSVPALIPYTKDQTAETKLTLTPTDNLKASVGCAFGKGKTTGQSMSQVGIDPTSGSSIGGTTGGDSKLNLSYSEPQLRDFIQWGTSLTYTFGPRTFLIGSASWGTNKWNMDRDLPRADATDFLSAYTPPTSFGFGKWLERAFNWTDVDGDGKEDNPTTVEDASTPGRARFRSRFIVNVYSEVPTETKYITHEVPFTDLSGKLDTIVVVSPQGWVEAAYRDLSGTYGLGDGGRLEMDGRSAESVFKGDLTHVIGDHTLKSGIEFIMTEIEYHHEYSFASLGRTEGKFRDYGGDWPTPKPTYLGMYVQDKFESEGMIANVGVRLERFNGGQKAYFMDDIFNEKAFGGAYGAEYFKRAAEELGWKTSEWGAPLNYGQVMDSLGVAIHPADLMNHLPYEGAKNHWCVSPRFGISHPVSDRTKLFFNFGQAYSKQKVQDMYGLQQHDNRLGGSVGRLDYVYYPNLRPGKTTQYEVGIEHSFPYRIVTTFRAYAKNAVDQSYLVWISGYGFQQRYATYRNAEYQDLKGLEIKIARTSGRFINGWTMYTRTSGGLGHVGFDYVHEDQMRSSVYEPYSAGPTVASGYNLTLVLSTPMDWGHAKGGWSMVVSQGYSTGGEVVYNPNQLPDRELNDENYIPMVDNYSISFSFNKRFALPGRRSLELGMSISNPLNTKRIGGLGGDSQTDYIEYIYGQRQEGKDLKYGDKSTFFLLTRPYQTAQGVWKPPLAPRTEWMHHGGPRSVSFSAAIRL